MSRSLIGCALAIAAMVVTIAAQTPPTQAPQTSAPATQAQAAPSQAKTVTVEGCVVREADVPGFKPNPAERVGVAEDYILTNTKMVSGMAPTVASAQKPGDSPVGTSGAAAGLMYDIEGIADSQLKSNVGKRVQIEGTFENVSSAKDKPTTAADLVELRGLVIREAAGDCPAAK